MAKTHKAEWNHMAYKYTAKMRKAEWNHKKNIHGKTCSFGIMNTCVLAFLFLRRIM